MQRVRSTVRIAALFVAMRLTAACAGASDVAPVGTLGDSAAQTVDADSSAATAPDDGQAIAEDTSVPDQPPSPLELAGQVDSTNLMSSIAALEGFGTRHTDTDGDDKARDWLVERLNALGLAADLDTFAAGTSMASNVIARKPGVEDATVVYIFSAHYDSTSSTPKTFAPGADDNASAVAAVLEAARILEPVAFRHSLWFVFTAAEEQGSLGSQHMVSWLKDQGVNVQGVIAPDMIGYWPLGDDDRLDLLGDKGSKELVDFTAAMADALGLPYKIWIHHDYCYGDDHTSFQEAGFAAISPMDCVEAHNVAASGESTPHYHQTSDTLATLNMPFTTRVAQVLVATLAALGVPVAP